MYRAVVAATLTLLFVVVGFALVVPVASAQNDCGFPGQPPCSTCGGNDQPACPACGEEGQPACVLCHNIGGPRDLGANCDGTGNCSFRVGSLIINVPQGSFLGISIPQPPNANALAAHLAHGDGFIVSTFNNLHLASTGQNHQASNVDCLAVRMFPQPPEPGN